MIFTDDILKDNINVWSTYLILGVDISFLKWNALFINKWIHFVFFFLLGWMLIASVLYSANPFYVTCRDEVFLRLLCPFQICLELLNDIIVMGNTDLRQIKKTQAPM